MKDRLRQAILTTIKANGLYVSGEFWITLVFRTEAELREIARELHINPDSI